jgi:hypothetical protein
MSRKKSAEKGFLLRRSMDCAEKHQFRSILGENVSLLFLKQLDSFPAFLYDGNSRIP